MSEQNQNHKIVRITKCKSMLNFVHAVKCCTHKSLLESKNIVCALWNNGNSAGTLLLNEGSITVEQWEAIAQQAGNNITWEYVNK